MMAEDGERDILGEVGREGWTKTNIGVYLSIIILS